MKNYKVSILIVTYNPSFEKLKLTLDSCLNQDFREFEIIVCDDGSKESIEENLKSYFLNANFTDYKLLLKKENRGTVKNHLDGLKEARGKYIKGISPGDLFYNEHSLSNMYRFMEDNNIEAAFGLLRAYYLQDGQIKTRRYQHPFDLIAYRNNNTAKIERNLILYSDHVCGAAMFFTKDFCEYYFKRIENTVIYEEDIIQVLACIEGRRFKLYDDYFIWYEENTGISRLKHSPFVALLEKDVDSFYRMMFSLFPNHKWLNKRKGLLAFYKIHNLYLRTALRFFKNPGLTFYMIEHWWQILTKANELKNPKKGFLDDWNISE